MGRASKDNCIICGAKQLVFFNLPNVPVHCNILWSRRDLAQRCPKGDIQLAFCPSCGFITNQKFVQSRLTYTQAYENSLQFSPFFRVYAQSLAKQLIKRYNLNNSEILEIGSGDGYFLKLLCQLGNSHGVGFDPAFIEKEKHTEGGNQVRFIQDIYSKHYNRYQGDLIVCRQTLEHVPNPKIFLTALRQIISNPVRTFFFFEVPNALHIFRKLSFCDIIYEHCSYFTPISLSQVFLSSGFNICDLETTFEGQFLCLHAQLGKESLLGDFFNQSSEVNQIASDITSFAADYQRYVDMWRQELENIENMEQRVVIWGAGSKGVTFLNTFSNTSIEYAVDINPRKQGMFIPGTGQLIVSPMFLRDYQPAVILVMNPIYADEIQHLTKKLGLTAELKYI